MTDAVSSLTTVRVLVATQNPKVDRSLARAFALDESLQFVGACRTGRDTLREVRELRPDVLLVSCDLPDMDCISLLRQLRKRQGTRTVLLLRNAGAPDLTEAVSLGAVGVLEPGVGADILVRCLRSVVRGEFWFRRDLTRTLVASLPGGGRPRSRLARAEASEQLTPRENDVMQAVARGRTNRQIAEELKMSEHTVKQHLKQVFAKLGVSSRVELVLHLADTDA